MWQEPARTPCSPSLHCWGEFQVFFGTLFLEASQCQKRALMCFNCFALRGSCLSTQTSVALFCKPWLIQDGHWVWAVCIMGTSPGRQTLIDGWKSLSRGSPNMNTLVSLGAVASFSVRVRQNKQPRERVFRSEHPHCRNPFAKPGTQTC